jgi:hypothetical protein
LKLLRLLAAFEAEVDASDAFAVAVAAEVEADEAEDAAAVRSDAVLAASAFVETTSAAVAV